MTRRSSVYILILGVLLLPAIIAPIACNSGEDTEITPDSKKEALADKMVDRYLAAWNAIDANQILGLYAGYTQVLIPSVGDFNYTNYQEYLNKLLAAVAEVDAKDTDRSTFLVSSSKATVKFRSWILLRTDADEFSATKTWVTWQLTWSDSGGWKIAQETGEDRIQAQVKLLEQLAGWIAGWEALNPDHIIAYYQPDATIVEPDGNSYTPQTYRTLLAEHFTGATSLAAEYLGFHLDNLTWDEAMLSFQMRYNKSDESKASVFIKTDYKWQLAPSDDTWIVTRQEAGDQEVVDDDITDDDAVDDDAVDDDAVDDDAVDDDAVDDDVVDDDAVDDDAVDDDAVDDDTTDDDTTDDDTVDKE